ncbi:unnamed protein product [Adineta steineri]|uniref:ABC transmembrane type-1 domain-containing protein n=1 Tax=Adineta steineri TaxID=433720 RepID=A0A820Q3Y4_9BILA|nr:unnamed protein product [Adineta steineri]
MLSQEIAWHDRPENHSGALCVRLSSDAEAVQKMTGIRISLLFEAIGSFGIGFQLMNEIYFVEIEQVQHKLHSMSLNSDDFHFQQ